MRKLSSITLTAVVCTAVLLLINGVAQAKPVYGGHCSDCHAPMVDMDAVEMTSLTTLDPAQWDDGFGNSGGRGPLPFFEVAPGGSVTITGRTTGDDPGFNDPDNPNSALNMYRWFKNGTSGSPLGDYIVAPTPTADWTAQTDGDGTYFWKFTNQDRGDFEFVLNVAGDTPLGIYDLETYFAVGPTDPNDSSSKSAQGVHYYVQVVPEVVPEPGTIVLLGIGLIGLGAYRWRRRNGLPL